MSLIDTKISGCKNWPEFRQLASQQKTEKDKGDLFERLTQLYLQTATEYQTKFKNVWWLNNKGEFPEEFRKKLNLPSRDEGIDLICETHDGEFWSVQSKYKTPDRPVTTSELGKFTTLSFVTANGIKGGLVVHTSTRKIKKSDLIGNCIEVGLQHWLSITQSEWNSIIEVCKSNKLKAPEKSKKRDYQIEAIAEAKKHFLKRNTIFKPISMG